MPPANQATLAQSVERLTRNEQVVSSILTSGSNTLGWFVHLGVLHIAQYAQVPNKPVPLSGVHARVAELVDAQDLGSCVFDVWVQVPSRALVETSQNH